MSRWRSRTSPRKRENPATTTRRNSEVSSLGALADCIVTLADEVTRLRVVAREFDDFVVQLGFESMTADEIAEYLQIDPETQRRTTERVREIFAAAYERVMGTPKDAFDFGGYNRDELDEEPT